MGEVRDSTCLLGAAAAEDDGRAALGRAALKVHERDPLAREGGRRLARKRGGSRTAAAGGAPCLGGARVSARCSGDGATQESAAVSLRRGASLCGGGATMGATTMRGARLTLDLAHHEILNPPASAGAGRRAEPLRGGG